MAAKLIVGNDGANLINGTSGNDVIYGYDPNGTQRQASTIDATRVATGLNQSLFAGAPAGDTGRLFIVEKTGLIKILDLHTGQVLATPFADLTSQVATDGEEGLLGLAFDPDFAHNGFFYVDLVNTSGDTEIRCYHVTGNPLTNNVAAGASGTPVFSIDQPGFSNHKGGWIGFGPDGDLYIATGDGGSGGDPFHNGQNINSLLGKMLRIDVHGDDFAGDPNKNYAIPGDNPFVGKNGADEIFAFGLRNPFRDSFDRALGTFYIGDVGQNKWEEIDIGKKGANYGWNIFEGPERFSAGKPVGGTATKPIHFYNHSLGTTVIGGYVYRGEGEALQGQYIFADFGTGHIYSLRHAGHKWVRTDLTNKIDIDLGAINNPASFAEDAFGNLYVVDLDGELFRLTPQGSSADSGDTLSGGGGDDMLFGGSGDDVLIGGAGADTLMGGDGFDTASYASSTDAVTVDLLTGQGHGGDAEGDILRGIEALIGSAQGDTLTGDGGDNSFQPGAGNDTVDGLGGNDTVSYAETTQGVVVNLAAGTATGAEIGTDQLLQIENVVGGDGDDDLTGDAGDNALAGGNGDDHLVGGGGDDLLKGGAGADRFEFAAPDGVSTVADFLSGTDRLLLNAAGFGVTNTDGTLIAAGVALVIGDTADSAAPTLLLVGNGMQVDVFWDDDGTGGDDAVLIAHVAALSEVNFGPATGLSPLAQADFNLDGIDDVVWRNPASGAVVEWLMGDGSITEITLPQMKGAQLIAAGDINGDDVPDLIWSKAGHNTAWLMNDDGTRDAVRKLPTLVGWKAVATGDFNGDGTTDILWQKSGAVREWLTGDGHVVKSAALGKLAGYHVAATGDVNGDGATDVIWANQAGRTVEWLMRPDGAGILERHTLDSTAGLAVAASADFNGDGTTDLLLRNKATGAAQLWSMAADGSIDSVTPLPSAAGLEKIAVADFNGDDTPDLLWRDKASGDTFVWQMQDGDVESVVQLLPAKGLQFVGVGDFDQDGNADILWKEPVHGNTIAWTTQHLTEDDWLVV